MHPDLQAAVDRLAASRVKWRPKATNRASAPCFAQPTVGRCGADGQSLVICPSLPPRLTPVYDTFVAV